MSVWRVPLAYTFLGAGFAGTTLFAQVYRYRQVSSPAQRQQTKWVVFGLAMALGGASVVALLDLVVPHDVLASLVGTTSFYLFTLLIPLSIAVAVLRYHLYGIDTLINRTLVYGLLTATLVALYFGGHRRIAEDLRLTHGPAIYPRGRGLNPNYSGSV